jgi:hypothetical protein
VISAVVIFVCFAIIAGVEARALVEHDAAAPVAEGEAGH